MKKFILPIMAVVTLCVTQQTFSRGEAGSVVRRSLKQPKKVYNCDMQHDNRVATFYKTEGKQYSTNLNSYTVYNKQVQKEIEELIDPRMSDEDFHNEMAELMEKYPGKINGEPDPEDATKTEIPLENTQDYIESVIKCVEEKVASSSQGEAGSVIRRPLKAKTYEGPWHNYTTYDPLMIEMMDKFQESADRHEIFFEDDAMTALMEKYPGKITKSRRGTR